MYEKHGFAEVFKTLATIDTDLKKILFESKLCRTIER